MPSAPSILPLTADLPAEASGSLGVASIPLSGENIRRKRAHTPDRLISISEVAMKLGISMRVLHKLMDTGRIPQPVKVGRTSRWFFSDIEKYMNSLSLTRNTNHNGTDSTTIGPDADCDLPDDETFLPDVKGEENLRLLHDRKLSIPEAARVMGIGVSSLRRIIIEGRLPVLKMMRKVLILESDVSTFLRDSRVTVKQTQTTSTRLPPLPKCVAESEHLK